jgi:hypothetical protein
MSSPICVGCHAPIQPGATVIELVRQRQHVAGVARPTRELAVVHRDHEGHAKREGWRRDEGAR